MTSHSPPAPIQLRPLAIAALLAFAPWICLGSRRDLHAVVPTVDAAGPGKAAMSRRAGGGRWHTQGASLLDAAGETVKLVGLNWSGFETTNGIPGGLTVRDYKEVLDNVKRSGFNVIRIPLSNEMIERPTVPSLVGYRGSKGSINVDLKGLTSLEILDKVVSYSQSIGLKLILDNHRSNAGGGPQENGLWFTPEYPESTWVRDWTGLARRYASSTSVIAFDLRNEPHSVDGGGACWDCGGVRDWHLAAQRAGNAILKENRGLLIIVEGVDEYHGDRYWWGANLEGVRESPVKLTVPNHLVYSAHEYGPVEYPQPWFSPRTSSADLVDTWVKHWAFISDAQIAPVYLGEFGTTNDAASIESSQGGSQGLWFSSLVSFLSSHPKISWTYWSANGEDRYAYFDRSYSIDRSSQAKISLLDSIRAIAPWDADIGTRSSSMVDSLAPTERGSEHSAPLVTTNSPFPTADPRATTPDLLSRASRSPYQDRIRMEEQRAIAESIRNAVNYATERSQGNSFRSFR